MIGTFRKWDSDGGGRIDRAEFAKAAEALGVVESRASLDMAFKKLVRVMDVAASVETLSYATPPA